MNKENAKLVAKITELAINISEKHGIPVFSDYSGHVDLISIQIGSKSDYSKKIAWDDIYRNHHNDESLTERLNKIITTLKHLYKTGELPEGLPINTFYNIEGLGTVKLS